MSKKTKDAGSAPATEPAQQDAPTTALVIVEPTKLTVFEPEDPAGEQPQQEQPDPKTTALVVPLYDAKTKAYRQDIMDEANKLIAIAQGELAPALLEQERVQWKMAQILVPLRAKFPERVERNKKGEPEPQSWPYFCRAVLKQDEKFFSKWGLALRYVKKHAPEMLEHLDDRTALIVPIYQAARLSAIETAQVKAVGNGKQFAALEKVRKDVHQKTFGGQFKTHREFEAAMPELKSGGGGGGGPKPYELETVKDGSQRTLKSSLDSFPEYKESVWVGGKTKGKQDALKAIAKAMNQELKVDADSQVCWLVWSKK